MYFCYMIKDFATFHLLLDEVKAKLGKPLHVNHDFELLSSAITTETGSYISTSTLKRYWRQKDTKENLTCNLHRSTLDILASYIGYPTYEAYERQETLTPTKTSHPIANERIIASQLAPGQQLCLTWAPDREVIVRHDTGNHFTIIKSINSKLQSGDTFEVAHIVKRCPLVLLNLNHADCPPSDYICAQNYSLDIKIITTD